MQAAKRPPDGPQRTRPIAAPDDHNGPVMTVRVRCSAALTEAVTRLLRDDPTVSALAVYRGAGLRPPGDVIDADIPRESANTIVDALIGLGVQVEGSIELMPVGTWVSRPGLDAERRAPGASADAVVWTQVIERAYAESALTWTFATFMVLATLLAAIAIVTDSAILVIGAMVLGPEFVPIAALGLGLVRRRYGLLRQAAAALAIGFAVSISVTACLALVARLFGLITVDDIQTSSRVGTSFIYTPDKWSLIIAIIAGAAGVLSLTSDKAGGLVGVFISVTTIPASGNIALALVFAEWHEFWGSSLQLVVNISGMALAGWATLALQQRVWASVSRSRARRAQRRPAPR
jgi:uncharacterized hydrophobic protein (TIGR00271 family)